MQGLASDVLTVWVFWGLYLFSVTAADDGPVPYYCAGRRLALNATPGFAGYNFLYTTDQARDEALLTLYNYASAENVIVFELIPGFSVKLRRETLRELMRSDVTDGLKLVECDQLHSYPNAPNNATPRLNWRLSIPLLCCLTLLAVNY